MGRILRWGLLQLCQSLVNGLYLFFLGLEHVPSRSVHPRSLVGGPAQNNMHPTVPKTGSKIDPKRVHCSTKSQENSEIKGPKF